MHYIALPTIVRLLCESMILATPLHTATLGRYYEQLWAGSISCTTDHTWRVGMGLLCYNLTRKFVTKMTSASGDTTYSKLVPNSSGEQQLVLSAAQLLVTQCSAPCFALTLPTWNCNTTSTSSNTPNLNTTKLWWIYFHLHKNLINKNVLFLVFIYANLINFNVSWFSS